jgi:hypothetical protein
MTEQEMTRAPSPRAQRTAARNDSGRSGSQLASSNSASGARACNTSAQRTPCWLSRASRRPSERKDFVWTAAGSALPSWAR